MRSKTKLLVIGSVIAALLYVSVFISIAYASNLKEVPVEITKEYILKSIEKSELSGDSIVGDVLPLPEIHRRNGGLSSKEFEWVTDIGLKASKIVKIRMSLGDDSFSFEDATALAESIKITAREFGIPDETAFTIVNVESDFKSGAYRRDTGAIGLCQVTKVCLDEYNKYHKIKYTVEDVKKDAINLKVGFWYFHQLGTRYKNAGYPIYSARDAYIAYNVGPVKYKDQYKSLKSGWIYNDKKRKWEPYKVTLRYDRKASVWL